MLTHRVALPVTVAPLVDSHRSVSLAVLLLLAYFLLAGRVPAGAFIRVGALGLVLFLASVAIAGAVLWTVMRQQRREHVKSPDATLVEFGLGVLVSALAYIAVYPFEYYSGHWVGLALAAALKLRADSRVVDCRV